MQAAEQEPLVEDCRIGIHTNSHCKQFAAPVTSFEKEYKGRIGLYHFLVCIHVNTYSAL